MKIHHVDAGSFEPFGSRLMLGEGGYFEPAKLVCHCLVIETSGGLVLVDSGFGTADVSAPRERLGRAFLMVARPRMDLAQCMLSHVERLGYSARDVRDIVLTHLDMDHVGGISDFPEARIHVSAREHDAAMHPRTLVEEHRYLPKQWAHGPKWVLHETFGERWNGFDAVRALDEASCEVLILPLHGHTRGHTGVAVKQDEGWLVHCGDSYFFHAEVETPSRCTPGLEIYQRLLARDEDARRANRARLGELARDHANDVRLFCSHSPHDLARLGHSG